MDMDDLREASDSLLVCNSLLPYHENLIRLTQLYLSKGAPPHISPERLTDEEKLHPEVTKEQPLLYIVVSLTISQGKSNTRLDSGMREY